jgi:excisionase family DNA binding protein
VADILRVDRRTVYRWIQSGRLYAERINRRYRISKKALSEMIEKDTTTPKEEIQ